MKAPSSGSGWIRAVNEQRVLEAVLREGELTRADIARLSGLSKPTVSSVVAALQSYGVLTERGPVAGALGRPAVVYEVNPRVGYFVGYDIGGTSVHAGLANLFGEVVGELVAPTRTEAADALVQQLVSVKSKLIADAGIDESTVLGGAVGVPGVYDPQSDRVSAAYNVPVLEELALGAALREALGVPLVVENDVNFAALGEWWRGIAAGCEHFVTISIGTGVGMGAFLGGDIYRGSRGAAGEVGLLPLGVGDPFEPVYRAHGPFESAVGSVGLANRYVELSHGGKDFSTAHDQHVQDLFAKAEDGDPVALRALDEQARAVALGVAAVVAVLDPELVVLGGGIGAQQALLEPTRRYLEQLVPEFVRVEISGLGDRAGFYGAIAAGLRLTREELFKAFRRERRTLQADGSGP